MVSTKANIIAQLQKAILPLQGIKAIAGNQIAAIDLGPINHSFPNGSFVTGAVHEFFCTGSEDTAATSGFIGGLLAALMRKSGVAIWISSSRTLFPPALLSFGIAPDKIIFIDLKNEREVLWTMEEALKCNGLAAVVAETQELGFTASRRLQLAVEQSRVTGFIVRRKPRNLSTACVTRWKITSLPAVIDNNMPGLGFPRWNVQLLKVRNGKPGTWQVEWVNKKFRHAGKHDTLIAIPSNQKMKTG
ncbi:MAG: Error-prone repair protein ImuA [Chitinophagaceae bacterium]